MFRCPAIANRLLLLLQSLTNKNVGRVRGLGGFTCHLQCLPSSNNILQKIKIQKKGKVKKHEADGRGLHLPTDFLEEQQYIIPNSTSYSIITKKGDLSSSTMWQTIYYWCLVFVSKFQLVNELLIFYRTI